jgi:hypothetical protein
VLSIADAGKGSKSTTKKELLRASLRSGDVGSSATDSSGAD